MIREEPKFRHAVLPKIDKSKEGITKGVPSLHDTAMHVVKKKKHYDKD